MRNLTYMFVIVSVLFSTGGVAVRSSADSTAANDAVEEAKAATDAKICNVTPPEQKVRRAKMPLLTNSNAILLNTRGYNYARPGEAVPEALKAQQAPAAPEESATD